MQWFHTNRPFLRYVPSVWSSQFASTISEIYWRFAGCNGRTWCTPLWNYLDDFWTCGPPAPDDFCAQNLDIMLRTCSDIGFAVNPKKNGSPTTTLVLLGVQLDTATQEMRIDSSRLTEIINLLKVPMTWKIFVAYLTGFWKKIMAFSFLEYLFSF